MLEIRLTASGGIEGHRGHGQTTMRLDEAESLRFDLLITMGTAVSSESLCCSLLVDVSGGCCDVICRGAVTFADAQDATSTVQLHVRRLEAAKQCSVRSVSVQAHRVGPLETLPVQLLDALTTAPLHFSQFLHGTNVRKTSR